MQEISFPSDLLTVSKFCCAFHQVSQTLLSLGTAMPRCRKKNPASSRVLIKYLEMLFWNDAGWIHYDCWLNIWDLKNVFQRHIPSGQIEVDEYSSASGYLLVSLLNHASICHTYLRVSHFPRLCFCCTSVLRVSKKKLSASPVSCKVAIQNI